MPEKPVVYEWPESQKCMDCKNGEFIMSETYNNSNYLCSVGCRKNDGIYCPAFGYRVEKKGG